MQGVVIQGDVTEEAVLVPKDCPECCHIGYEEELNRNSNTGDSESTLVLVELMHPFDIAWGILFDQPISVTDRRQAAVNCVASTEPKSSIFNPSSRV